MKLTQLSGLITLVIITIALLGLTNCTSDHKGFEQNNGSINSSEYVNEEFRWKISKPQGSKFEHVEKTRSDINKGKEIIGNNGNGSINPGGAEPLVTIRRGELSKIQVGKVTHEEDLSLNWDNYLKAYQEFVYSNYAQMASVDSSSSVSQIDSTDFNVLTFVVTDRTSNVKMTHHIFKRYYPEKKAEFVINVTYDHVQDKYLLMRALALSEFY